MLYLVVDSMQPIPCLHGWQRASGLLGDEYPLVLGCIDGQQPHNYYPTVRTHGLLKLTGLIGEGIKYCYTNINTTLTVNDMKAFDVVYILLFLQTPPRRKSIGCES